MRTPDYFKQFSKKFRYFVTEQFPSFGLDDNFAYAFHNTKSRYCSIKDNKHWHVMIYMGESKKPNYPVPCPFTCFSLLIADGVNIQMNGVLFDELQETRLEYSAPIDTKPLPKVLSIFKKDVYAQSNLVTRVSIERYLKVLNGPHGGTLSAIIDCFSSGYGSYSSQNHSMVTNFSLDCSQAQCYCYTCTNDK